MTAPHVADFRFRHRLRVRWAEVDMQKIVFNGHYLMYFDTAVADYWRALALPYEAAMHQLGGDLYVKKASLEYHASAHYDERLDVALRCARIGNSSMQFLGRIERNEGSQRQVLIEAELIYVFADPATQTAQAVPASLRCLLEGFERGEPTWRVEVLTGQAWREAALGFAQASWGTALPESDLSEAGAVAINQLGQVVAVASPAWVRTAPVLRGCGIGRAAQAELLDKRQ
jgi:YbgC/YbaW family acyl-CoA thioester hydrolase